jgi:hypothetical protein
VHPIRQLEINVRISETGSARRYAFVCVQSLCLLSYGE